MNLSVGIVGLPNAGKSTLFNALLKKQAALAANYPFATIEPNVGIVPVPDKRLEKLAQVIASSDSGQARMTNLPPIVPATVKFVDIAGLVAGASKGEGLGNKFLAHIREVDLICHVVRYFEDSDVVHVAGGVDSERDKNIIETELILADLQTLEKQIEPRGIKDKIILRKWELIQLLKKELNNGKTAHSIVVDDEDKVIIYDLHLLTMKPVLIVQNVGENQALGPAGANGNDNSIIICAKIESELSALAVEEQKEYLKSLGWEASGLDRLIKTAYKTMGLISFLTAGEKEVRAWTIKIGINAQKAAGVIHTDFEKKFIKADVITFDEFVKSGGWTNARSLGKVRSEGRDYIMKDGDVVEFKVGA